MTLRFAWDPEKAEANLEKHGVDFVDAAQIFGGPRLEAPDERSDYGEIRLKTIGEHDGQVYVVVFTMRQQTIRIISAWKAGKHDRERYRQSVA